MRAILSLFGNSPFAPLQKHMEQVTTCIEKTVEIFVPFEACDEERVTQLSNDISKLEHAADLIKNDIRNHLPKSLFLPVDRGNLLEILAIQDGIADKAEDIGILLAIKPLKLEGELKDAIHAFLDKNIDCFQAAKLVIDELHELLQSSFGGVEAEKVKQMVEDVAFKEHEADLIQRKLLKILYNNNSIDFKEFHLWTHIIENIGAISDLSEKLANRVRMTLDLK